MAAYPDTETTDPFEGGGLTARTSPYSFTVRGKKITFPGQDDSKENTARIVRHERPYRKGAKLDNTGSAPRVWSVRAIFNNTIEEPGLEGSPLYPDRMIELEAMVDEFETGDFFHPIDGAVRARLEKASRTISHEEVDTGVLMCVFVEDNEEAVDAKSITRPAVSGAAERLSEQTAFTAEHENDWTGGIEDLKEFCSELEGLMMTPGRTVDDVNAKVRSARRSVESVIRTSRESNKSTSESLRTTGNATERHLERLLDAIGFAAEERNGQRPQPKSYKVKERTNIFTLASLVKQPVDALLDLNEGRITDPFVIEPGTYRIYERWP